MVHLCYFEIYLVSTGFYWINPAFNVSLRKKKACFNVRQYDTPKSDGVVVVILYKNDIRVLEIRLANLSDIAALT